MTFCTAKCKAKDCPRKLTPEVIKEAEYWWGSPEAPMAIADFSDECHYFEKEG